MARHQPRHRSTSTEVEELVRKLAANGERRVPNEDFLASELGVSRPTIRTALQALQRDGLIRRRHGTGTLINHFAFGRNRTSITAERDIMAHIKECGHEPRFESVAVLPSVPHEDAAAELGVPADEPLCEIRRVYTADEVPAVLTYEYIPEAFIHVPAEARVPFDTILDFVAACTEYRVAYTVTSLVPAVADAEVASTLALPPGTPILCFDSLQIASTETRVAFSRSWVSYGVVRYCVVRDQGG